jgi:DNA-binding transcriptional MerR regulator
VIPPLLSIGAVAAASGVSRDAIRYYERLGLLPKAARTAAGYRQYPPAVLNRLGLVRNAQRFGFSLTEIAGFLRIRDGGGKPCHAVRAAGERMLAAVDDQIAALQSARAEMDATLRTWQRTLGVTPAHQQARLLEMLEGPGPRPRVNQQTEAFADRSSRRQSPPSVRPDRPASRRAPGNRPR